MSMPHLTPEGELDAYYGELALGLRLHLEECPECRSHVEQLGELLDGMREDPVPERGASYGGQVWARLLPQLPPVKRRQWWLQSWMLAPALLTLLVIAFVAGMVTQRDRKVELSARARERVLLMAMSDHLERSQIVLAELLNSTSANLDLTGERDRSRDLLSENRLLRQTAAHDGDLAHAALLDDLERVLLDIANSPSDVSSGDLAAWQQRLDNGSLLFRVRVTSTDARRKGQKL